MLRHYLGDTGDPVNIDPKQLMSEIPEFKNAVDSTVQREVAAIVVRALTFGDYGRPIPFRTGWIGFYPNSQKYPDWFRAIGGFDYSVGGIVTVYPAAEPGGPPTVRIESQVDIATGTTGTGASPPRSGP
ncbi:hypothetical protein [Nocardia sp. NPDC020380]|uniref:hypothetical protein n=1 Tax=Nocardia sp. NPDC020380 TaxID=3364309 RepID=UPI0037979B19